MGNIYAADFSNHRVQLRTPGWSVVDIESYYSLEVAQLANQRDSMDLNFNITVQYQLSPVE